MRRAARRVAFSVDARAVVLPFPAGAVEAGLVLSAGLWDCPTKRRVARPGALPSGRCNMEFGDPRHLSSALRERRGCGAFGGRGGAGPGRAKVQHGGKRAVKCPSPIARGSEASDWGCRWRTARRMSGRFGAGGGPFAPGSPVGAGKWGVGAPVCPADWRGALGPVGRDVQGAVYPFSCTATGGRAPFGRSPALWTGSGCLRARSAAGCVALAGIHPLGMREPGFGSKPPASAGRCGAGGWTVQVALVSC